MQLYDFKEIQERVILVGVQTDSGDDVETSLDELQELAETAGAETAAKVIQTETQYIREPISEKAKFRK